jgi:predicted nucleic acid binding AN1-type Zn finger protein
MPPKCDATECSDRAQRFNAGECDCGGNYCGAHRLMEDHTCPLLESCKAELYERNAAQLLKERTPIVKGI